MATWGDVETYNDMISDLGTFCTEINNACGIMMTAANTCVQIMEEDKASLNASKNVALSCKKYEEAAELAQKLMKALEKERDDIVEYLHSLEELEGE